MHPELASRFEALEQRRARFTDRVRALSPEKQTAHVEKKEFSPLEVLQHMALAEQFDVELMRKRPPEQLKGRRAKTNFIYRNAIGKMEAGKRLPTMGAMVPKTQLNANEADQEWQSVRANIRQFLEKADSPDAPVMKSILGTLSAADLLRLFEAHMHYHETRFPQV